MPLDDTCTSIVIFSARYLPSMGGVEFFTDNLAHALAGRGYEVTIVTTEASQDSAADAREAVGEGSVEVLRLHSWGPERMPFIKRDAHTKACLERIEALGRFHALINTRFYDLSRAAVRLCKKLGVKPVLIDHGTGYITFPSKPLSLAFKVAEHAATALLLRSPVDCYGVSKDSSQWLKTFGISSCGEIHNALDAEVFVAQKSERDFHAEYGVRPGTLCVTYAARLLPEKGIDAIIESARSFREDRRVHFFVAGSGDLEGEVIEADHELANLSYLGRLSHPDLAALLCDSDVFCFPTRYAEGLPTTLLEAGACGCALVSSRAGGVNEIIPTEEDGIVIPEASGYEVSVALSDLLQEPDRLASLKERARENVCERFTWESTVEEVLSAFRRASC